MKRFTTLAFAAGALALLLVGFASDPASAGWRRGWGGYYGPNVGVYVGPGYGYYRPYPYYGYGNYPYAYYPYWRGRYYYGRRGWGY